MQDSSGYPSWAQCEEDKYRYIEDYQRAEGIALDKADVLKVAQTITRNMVQLTTNNKCAAQEATEMAKPQLHYPP